MGRRLLTGTSDTLFCLQGGRWLGPSFWLPQVSESLGTELHSSAAEVGLMTLSASIRILLTKAFFCQGLSNVGWDWVLAWRGDGFPGQAVSQELTECGFAHKTRICVALIRNSDWWAKQKQRTCSVVSDSLRPRGLYVAYQAPPSVGFSRQEYWSGLPFPSPGDLPNPGIQPGSPALQADTSTGGQDTVIFSHTYTKVNMG